MHLKGNFLHSHQLKFHWREKRRQKILFGIKVASIILAGFIVLAGLFSYPFIIKAKLIYEATEQGKANLEHAQSSAIKFDFKNSRIFLAKAEENFSFAQRNMSDFQMFKKVPWLGKQITALDNLLITSTETTSAINDVVSLAEDMFKIIKTTGLLGEEIGLSDKNLTFAKITTEQKKNILKSLFEAPPLLQGAKAKIDLAMISFERIPENEVMAPLKRALRPLAEKLPELQDTITKAIPAAEILPQLLGYPSPKTYLFLLQNNSELRPTGGFIGTYGIVKFDTAEMKTFVTDNIYKLDAPAESFLMVPAPKPIQKYIEVPYWYLRDANWSPDFPTAARKAEELYLKEIEPFLKNKARNQKDPWYATVESQVDGVIAVTPEVIKDLLNLLGGVTIDGQKINAENLIDVLEYRVGKGYVKEGIPEIQRKEVVGKLAVEIKNKLFSLPTKEWPKFFNILKNNLNEKHILIYDKGPELKNLLRTNNWDGKVIDTDGDYLMVVDANMASLKTDQVMERAVDYKLQARDGELIARVKINYTNTGVFTWKTTRYRTYTRVYVPEGSELLSGEGMMENDKIKDPDGKKGAINIGREFGKTYFGSFISIEPGETRSLTFEYKLPEKIKRLYRSGLYNFFVQKQPGTVAPNLTVALNFDKNIKTWHPLGLGTKKTGGKSIEFTSNLREDRVFGVRF